jgi:hypothetical protein
MVRNRDDAIAHNPMRMNYLHFYMCWFQYTTFMWPAGGEAAKERKGTCEEKASICFMGWT